MQLKYCDSDFLTVRIDYTPYWREDIKTRSKVYSYYLIDLTKPTCLCSPEINYPYEHLRNEIEDTSFFTEDEIDEIERQDIEDCGYFLDSANFTHYKKHFGEYPDILEYEIANPSYLF